MSKSSVKTSSPPIAQIIELLGKKWMMRVIWELRSGALTFRGLQERCDNMSPSVLNTRLRELEENSLIDKNAPGGYELSALGRELLIVYEPLNVWAAKWVEQRDKR